VSRRPQDALTDALTHLRLVTDYAHGDLTSQLTIDAICMRLSAGIEALATIDAPIRDDLFGRQWPQMWGLRNRIAHGYLLINTDILTATLQRDVPDLITTISTALTHVDHHGQPD
jgi:uncharacterized protein with HEPN domain